MRKTMTALAAAAAIALTPAAALAAEADAARADAAAEDFLEPGGAGGQDALQMSSTAKTVLIASLTTVFATGVGLLAANDSDNEDDDDGDSGTPPTTTTSTTGTN